MESTRKRPARTHCAKCGVELTDENCHRRQDSGGYRSDCKDCRSVRRRELHDEQERARRLFVTRSVCDICGQPERQSRGGVTRLLNKDHDHITGEWRGLLCTRCNSAIGLFADNTELMHRAIEYLRNPPGLVIVEDEPTESRQEWRRRRPV